MSGELKQMRLSYQEVKILRSLIQGLDLFFPMDSQGEFPMGESRISWDDARGEVEIQLKDEISE